MRRWLENYGFAFLVLAALMSASYQAATVAVPDPVPDFALKAEQVYRLEVGAAFFVVFYLAAMALILALSGRGFAEFGTKGLRVEKIIDRTTRQQLTLHRQLKLDRRTTERLNEQEKRLEKLERKALI